MIIPSQKKPLCLPIDLQCMVYAYEKQQYEHFDNACKENNIHDLQLLIDLCSFVWHDHSFLIQKLNTSCWTGCLHMVEFLATKLNDMRATNNAFIVACRKGHLPIVQYLSTLLTVADMRKKQNAAFRASCAHG